MKPLYKPVLVLVLLLASFQFLNAQQRFFTDINESKVVVGEAKRVLIPQKYRTLSVNTSQLKTFLWGLPSESVVDRRTAPVLEFPMPDGKTAHFHVWESSIQEPGLAAKFPEIRTFAGQGIDDPYATIRFDYNPYFGFHAQILSLNGDVYIDPYARGNVDYYMSYNRADNKRSAPFTCYTNSEREAGTKGLANKTTVATGPCRGTQLYTYRLAVACTGEYAAAVGATTAGALHAAIVTSVNRVDGVYETEVAVRMILVANNNVIEYLNAATDPFTGNNNGNVLIGESQTVITANIGSANFDIGHTFSTGGGGLAGLGVVCDINNKAGGITGSSNPVGDSYDIDYVAHEMGHQFGGDHTFNSTTGSCNGNRSGQEAYEVGSGTTIMAYAGICGSDDTQPHSDAFFHTVSFDEISNFLQAGGGACKVVINTGNTLPVITAMNNSAANIPLNTPFTLTASATDADGDAISYCWEEWDLGASGAWNNGANNSTSPLFKSRAPKTVGSRTFPDMAVILAGYPTNPAGVMGGLKGETLPNVARVMKFRLTVRDNRAAGGGVVTGGNGCQTGFTTVFPINAITGTGPFVVSVPNGGESYAGGSTQTVTWSVAGTTAAPINCANVKISLSTDGGLTYPTVLIASTPNTGSANITLPSITTTTARVKVEAVGNVFFDISNANFNITASTVPGYGFVPGTPATVTCSGPTSADVTLGTTSVLAYSTPINLTASGNSAGTTVSFSVNPVTPGNSTIVTLNNTNTLSAGSYNVTVTSVSGTITKTTTLTYVVSPGTGPVIVTQPAAQIVCVGTDATFSVSATGASSYQWQVSTNGGTNYGNITGATAASYTVAAAPIGSTGNLYRVVTQNQCNTTTSNGAALTVYPVPTVTLSASPYTSLYPGLTTTLTATVTPSTGAIISWYKNGNLLPGVSSTSLIINVSGIGSYVAKAAIGTGCVGQSAPLEIGALPKDNVFIFPSPNNGHFNVSYYNAAASGVQILTIYDARGALVFNKSYVIANAYELMKVDMVGAARGIYLVVVRDGKGGNMATGKVFIDR